LPLPSWMRREQSFAIRPADVPMSRSELAAHLAGLGDDGAVARRLDGDVDDEMGRVSSLSALTAPLAVAYMDRLARPIPSLTPEIGVQLVGRAYVGHLLVEADPARVGAPDVPVIGTLPALKNGRPPQDILSRVVKVSRGRTFPPLCALSPRAWDGFVHCLTKRAHDMAPRGDDLVSVEVVDGVARFAWILRQADLHYGLEPERPGS
jgi:hypothetical protein